MKKLFILPLFLAIITIVGFLFAGHISPFIYIQPLSILLALVLPLLIMLTHFNFMEIIGAFGAAMDWGSPDRKGLRRAAHFFKSLQVVMILIGIVGILLAVIAMLAELADYSQLGYWLAGALLSAFYSVLGLTFVAVPFRSAVLKRLIDLDEA